MAIFLTSSGDDPNLLAARVRLLDPFPVVVHLDRRHPTEPWREAVADDRDRVVWIPDHQRVRESPWGLSAAIVQFHLLEQGLLLAPPDEYLVVLRPDDLPLVDPLELTRSWEGRQQIRYVRAVEHPQVLAADIELWQHYDPALPPRLEPWRAIAVRSTARVLPAAVGRRPLPTDSPVAHGESTWALTREAAAHCVRTRTPRSDRWFARTKQPARMYVHTLIATSPFHRETPDFGYARVDCGHDCLIPGLHCLPRFDESHIIGSDDLARLDSSGLPFATGARLPASSELVATLVARRGLRLQSMT